MIVTLNDTTASKIGGAIVEARRTVGSGSGLVHTLICSVTLPTSMPPSRRPGMPPVSTRHASSWS